MQGATRITMVVGGLLVGMAWLYGATALLGEHRTITDLLAEAVAAVVVVLAWRYRRHRLAAAALVTAGTASLIRVGRLSSYDEPAAALIAVSFALDVVLLSLTRDRPLRSAAGGWWLLLIALQGSAVVIGSDLAGDALRRHLDIPAIVIWLSGFAFVTAAAAFLLRRGAFAAGLFWVAAAWGLALAGWRGPHEALILLSAAVMALLVGLIEDAYRLAFHDELTGLPGRRALDEALAGLGGDCTIAMADVDRFKLFNDRHGHDAGDQVLRMVADELARVGGGGTAYRYGGEEFAVVFPGKPVAEVREHVETVHRSIADREFALRGPDRPKARPDKPKRGARKAKTVTVTVSIGLADSNSRRPTPRSVLKAADRALYRAKNGGRNMVVAAGDRLPRKGG